MGEEGPRLRCPGSKTLFTHQTSWWGPLILHAPYLAYEPFRPPARGGWGGFKNVGNDKVNEPPP